MIRYKDFRPTQHDSSGLGVPQYQDWFVGPCSVTRDSQALEISNFETLKKAVQKADPHGTDHDTPRFGHWGPGWFEIILVRPDSYAYAVALECEEALENYPVLDEMDLSIREGEESVDAFYEYTRRELVHFMTANYNGALADFLTMHLDHNDALDLFRYEMESNGEGARYIFPYLNEPDERNKLAAWVKLKRIDLRNERKTT